MHLPNLISDLALILIVAGVTTIIFKKIRQPLVLGYIVAGFLTGPYFTAIPTVVDMESIHVWSEIGIICLMFALGLEFSFHKLSNVGGTAIITALTEVCGLFLFGFAAGHFLGWKVLDSVILGGILSMSSTTIIIKAFEELNLKGKKFTEIVFGALIVEDIVGIFLMVFMSTFAMSKGSGSGEIFVTVAKLMFYLVLWLVLGIYAIPTLLKKAKGLMNDETLLIASLGVCFGMVLLFSYIGFSTALGSFIAGSILAGTVFSEKIEHLLKPIKDLFGSVFFISVGMLVDPAILAQYTLPIIVITITTILGKLIFSSLGVMLSGQKLNTAIHCGASLAQIGEFAFIIAALGMSLKLNSSFIYPIVVSVSVITTFTTPFCIKHADKIFLFVKKFIPVRLYEYIERHTSDSRSEKERDDSWGEYLRNYFLNMLVRVVLILGLLEAVTYFVEPFLERFFTPTVSGLISATIALSCMSPFLVTLLRSKDKNVMVLLIKSKTNHFPIFVFMILRVVITASLIAITISRFIAIPTIFIIMPAIIFIVLISHSDWVMGKYFQIEARFLANFNEKLLLEQEADEASNGACNSWPSEELWVAEYQIDTDCPFASHTLGELRWPTKFKVDVIKIISGKKHINIPEKDQKFRIGDTVFLLGIKEQIGMFDHGVSQRSGGMTRQKELVTLRDFISSQSGEKSDSQLLCYAVKVNEDLHFEGKNIKESGIRKEWNCNIIGIKRGRYPILYPDVQFVINKSDQIWLLGCSDMMGSLVRDGIIQHENFAL